MSTQRLIGTSDWNPIGKSMWAIVAELSQLNYLDWLEIRRWFGSDDRLSFRNPQKQDPDCHENFALPRIAQITGWSPNIYRASFSDFYRPPWMLEHKYSKVRIAMAVRVRICPECIHEGVHLTLHQMVDWKRCPLHGASLRTQCPSCGTSLPIFKVFGPFENPLHCENCKNRFWKRSVRDRCGDIEIRKNLLEEYQRWMTALEKALRGSNSKYLWLDGPAGYKDLAYAHQLVPGPEWADKCLVHADSIRRSTHVWIREPVSYPPPVDGRRRSFKDYSDFLLVTGGRANVSTELGYEINRLSQRVRRVGEHLSETFRISLREAAVYQPDATSCIPRYGSCASAWSTGFWLWRRSVDAVYPHKNTWSRSRWLPSLLDSYVWRYWVNGPGSLLWSYAGYPRFWQNAAFVEWLTELWVLTHFLEVYLLFVGLACRGIGQGLLPTIYLETQLHRVGELPAWILEHRAGQVRVHHLSKLASPEQFVALYRSGFRGIDEHYFEDFASLEPLVRLFQADPERRHLWYLDWRCAGGATRYKPLKRRRVSLLHSWCGPKLLAGSGFC